MLYVNKSFGFFLGKLILWRSFVLGEGVLLEMVFYILKLFIGIGFEFNVVFIK